MAHAGAPYLAMARNNAWANQTLFAAIGDMSDANFAAARPGFFPSLRATLNHIWQVDLYYLDALEGGGRGLAVIDLPEIETAPALAVARAKTDTRLIRFCQTLTQARLTEFRTTDRPGNPVPERVDALLLHLFQHQIHHRGQAHTMLLDAGIAPPQLDEFYLTFDRAPSASGGFD